MKKIYLFILVILFAGCGAFATVVTQRRVNPAPPVQNTKQQKVANNIKTCKPYTESMNSDYMGMNISYNLTIRGWINNKCRLDFNADIKGTSASFQNMYGIEPSDATILSFAPKIRCEFTKQQLAYVGDSILQEDERNNGAYNNMLKDPNNIDLSAFGSLSSADQKLIDVIVNQGACTILNASDLENLLR